MFTLKGIYRDTIRPLRRAYQDFQTYAQQMNLANEEYLGQVAGMEQQMKAVIYDSQTLPEAKYILVNTQLDTLEKLTTAHFQRVGELQSRQAQLNHDVKTFIERCAADHPGVDRDELSQLIVDALKIKPADANF